MANRRPWIALYVYEKKYGRLDYELPDDRIDKHTCRWCHGTLPKRNKTFCCPEHRHKWERQYVFNRGRPPVPWRILCRDRFACRDCGWMSGYENEFGVWVFSPNGLDVHHIVPVCEGGIDQEGNLVTLCHDCHLHRHGKENRREPR